MSVVLLGSALEHGAKLPHVLEKGVNRDSSKVCKESQRELPDLGDWHHKGRWSSASRSAT